MADDGARSEMVDFRTEPARYKHWKLGSTGRSPRWPWT